VYGELEPSEAD